MKTLKRTLCLVLVAVMALGLFAVAASAKKLSDYDDAAAVSAAAGVEGTEVCQGIKTDPPPCTGRRVFLWGELLYRN